MFGRRKREEQAAESVREADRRAVFAELAKRPEGVCPFLGVVDARAEYRPEPSGEHRCYAFGDPAPVSDEQQRHVCLETGYSNCPRYLRGVLVIPSEELEALRHPQAAAPPPAPAPSAEGRGSRRGLALVALLVVLIAAVGAGGFFLLGGPNGFALGPTPSPSIQPTPSLLPSAYASASASPSVSGTPVPATSTPRPTPIVVPSSGVLPTPGPSDTPTGTYAVVVKAGSYPVFVVDDSGVVTAQKTAVFAPEGVPYSGAPVQRIQGQDGRIYWRTEVGTYTGLAYTKDLSGDFAIYEVYSTSVQGVYTYQQLSDSQL